MSETKVEVADPNSPGKLADLMNLEYGVGTVTDSFTEIKEEFDNFKDINENRWNDYYLKEDEIDTKLNNLQSDNKKMKTTIEFHKIYTDQKIKNERELITKFFSGYIDGYLNTHLEYIEKRMDMQNKIIGILSILNIVSISLAIFV